MVILNLKHHFRSSALARFLEHPPASCATVRRNDALATRRLQNGSFQPYVAFILAVVLMICAIVLVFFVFAVPALHPMTLLTTFMRNLHLSTIYYVLLVLAACEPIMKRPFTIELQRGRIGKTDAKRPAAMYWTDNPGRVSVAHRSSAAGGTMIDVEVQAPHRELHVEDQYGLRLWMAYKDSSAMREFYLSRAIRREFPVKVGDEASEVTIDGHMGLFPSWLPLIGLLSSSTTHCLFFRNHSNQAVYIQRSQISRFIEGSACYRLRWIFFSIVSLPFTLTAFYVLVRHWLYQSWDNAAAAVLIAIFACFVVRDIRLNLERLGARRLLSTMISRAKNPDQPEGILRSSRP